MDIKALTPNLSISPQILISEMQAVAEAGFKAIICNRPDGEGPDQPSFQEIEAAARQHGLQAQYLPAETGKVRDEDGKVFGQLLQTLPGPVLAYCRSGMRSTTLWALSQSGVTPLPQILEASQKVGFDMKALVQRIANGRHAATPRLLGRVKVTLASALCIWPNAAPVECACAGVGSVTDTPSRHSIKQAGRPATV